MPDYRESVLMNLHWRLCEPAQWVTDDTTVYTSWGIAPVKGYLVALLLEEKVSFPRQ